MVDYAAIDEIRRGTLPFHFKAQNGYNLQQALYGSDVLLSKKEGTERQTQVEGPMVTSSIDYGSLLWLLTCQLQIRKFPQAKGPAHGVEI